MSQTHQSVCLLLLSMTVKMTQYVFSVTNCLSLLNFWILRMCVLVGNIFQFFFFFLVFVFVFLNVIVLVPIVSLLWSVEVWRVFECVKDFVRKNEYCICKHLYIDSMFWFPLGFFCCLKVLVWMACYAANRV